MGHLPAPREYLEAVTLNGRLYVIGGENEQGSNYADVLELDPLTGEILRTAQLPFARSHVKALALNGKIYAFGGWNYKALAGCDSR